MRTVNDGQPEKSNEVTSLPVVLVVAAAVCTAIAVVVGVLLSVGILAFSVAIPVIAVLALVATSSGVVAGSLAGGKEKSEEPEAAVSAEAKEPVKLAETKEPAKSAEIKLPTPKKEVDRKVHKHRHHTTKKISSEADGVAVPQRIGKLSSQQKNAIESLAYTGRIGNDHYFFGTDGMVLQVPNLESLKKLPNLKNISVPTGNDVAVLGERLADLKRGLPAISVTVTA
jgi:hypothetical protein